MGKFSKLMVTALFLITVLVFLKANQASKAFETSQAYRILQLTRK
ncbi:hypothetical protein [Niabella terrae]